MGPLVIHIPTPATLLYVVRHVSSYDMEQLVKVCTYENDVQEGVSIEVLHLRPSTMFRAKRIYD